MRCLSCWLLISVSLTAATPTPKLAFQNYFGTGPNDTAGPIATDAQGNIYVSGTTNSINFPSGTATRRTAAAPLVAVASEGTVTGLPVANERSVTAIAGDASGVTVYAATPDGVLVSVDSGVTWRQTAALPLSVQPVQTVNAVAVDPADSSRAYVATGNGIFGTIDAGHSWFPLDQGLAASGNGSIQATFIAVSAKDHRHLFAATGNPDSVYRSTDAGSHWVQLAPGSSPIAVAFNPVTEDLYVVGSDTVLVKSTDGGTTWQRLGRGLSGASLLALDPRDSSNIYVVDTFGIVRSSDGGSTFVTIRPAVAGQLLTAIAVDPQSGAIALSTPTAVYLSRDRGATWTTIPGAGSSSVHALAWMDGRLLIGRDSPSTVYVIKFDSLGKQILYTAFFGGTNLEIPTSLAIDASGAAVVAGETYSPDFPVTAGVVGTSFPASATSSQPYTGFVTKISPDGSRLIYSTLLGPGGTRINALALDGAGNAYLTGSSSQAFPTTSRVLQPAPPAGTCTRPVTFGFVQVNLGVHAFVAKLSADATALGFSTFFSGTCGSIGNAIALDRGRNIIIGGTTTSPDIPVATGSYQDAFPGPTDRTTPTAALTAGFLAKLSPPGDKLLSSTYVGGGFETAVNAIALDAAGNIAVAGETWGLAKGATRGAAQPQITINCAPVLGIGPSPPPSNGYDAFVLKLDADLRAPIGATYLGGGCADSASAIQLDAMGNAWIAGYTQSADFPLVAPFGGLASGISFVSELSSDFTQLLFSSYIETSNSLAIAADGNVFVPGKGLSGGAYLAKIDPLQTLAAIIDKVSAVVTPELNPPAPLYGGLAPGELIRITGRNLGPAVALGAQLDATGRLTSTLGSTRVFFDQIPAPLVSVQADSIVCIAPFEIVPNSFTEMRVEAGDAISNSMKVGIRTIAPEILAIANQDSTANSASHPAAPGSVITLYVSGLGQTNPPSVDGALNAAPLPTPVVPVSVNVNGQGITPSFVGGAPGLAAGITQINVPLPPSGYTQNVVNIVIYTNAVATLYVTAP